MLNETFVSVFFRLLNFIVLIGLAAFIFKRYFRKSIEESIEQKRLEEINVGNQIRDLEHRSKNLSEEIVRQEQLCEYLIEKTAQWKQAFEHQTQDLLKEQKKLAVQAQLKTDKQAEIITRERLTKAVIPIALEQTTQKLKDLYADPKNNKDFIDPIIGYMEKSS